MYVSYDKHGVIRVVSDSPVSIANQTTISTNEVNKNDKLVGKKICLGAQRDKLRVALICNWADRCGIADYTAHLVKPLRDKVGELRIFAEEIDNPDPVKDDYENVNRCWRRGTSMVNCIKQVLNWKPDIVFIQHEFGIFPKATHFLKMLELLSGTPYVVTLHSVYEHLDKTICTAYIKDMIVHSQDAKDSLARNGHLNNVNVILHGCVQYPDHSELWNIFQNDYAIIQFGFGFHYKGVDVAIEAIHHLKQNHEKFKDIFYCYMCTESPHTKVIQQDYYNYLSDKVQSLGLEENVVIVRGFLSEKHISNFLRTAKLAIFPYKNNLNNVVYGASGAVRNAMANGIPIIASDCHLFDDIQGVVPRISDHVQLAEEIDRVFSNTQYKADLVQKNLEFVERHNWDATADSHVAVFDKIIARYEGDVVRIRQFTAV